MKIITSKIYPIATSAIMLSVFSATMADSTPTQGLLRIPRVSLERKLPPKQTWLCNDSNRQLLNVDELHRGISQHGEVIPFTGKGVVIGMIDCGIDPRHPAFFNPNTCDSRVALYVTTSSMREEESGKLSYNLLRPMEGEKISKKDVDVSANGHGTHTSCTAGGSNTGVPYYGMAPDATFVMTSVGDYIFEDEIELGITAALDYARQHNMPCVASLSIGSCGGMHDGTGYMTDLLADEMDSRGQIVCFAAGNDGLNYVSIHKDFSKDPTPLRTAFSHGNWGEKSKVINTFFVSEDENFDIAFTLVRVGPNATQEEWMSPYISLTDISEEGNQLLSHYSEIANHLQDDNAYLTVRKIYGIGGNCGLELTAHLPWEKEDADYTLGVAIKSDAGADVHGFADFSSLFHNYGIATYSKGNADESISDYCTSPYVISVGGMNERESYIDINGHRWEADTESFGPVHAAGLYSSIASLPEKLPHTMASGVDVISALQEGSNYTKVCRIEDANKRYWHYGACSGTSMATPAVAGMIALWLQANPLLTRDDVIMLLQKSDNNGYGTERSQFGVPSAYEGLKYILENMSGIDTPTLDNISNRPAQLMIKYVSPDVLECVLPFHSEGGVFTLTSADGCVIRQTNFSGTTFFIDLSGSKGVFILQAQTPQGSAVQKIRH